MAYGASTRDGDNVRLPLKDGEKQACSPRWPPASLLPLTQRSSRHANHAREVRLRMGRSPGLTPELWTEPRDAVRLVGAYACRILAGSPPQDLPVQAPTKFEMAVNLRTAGALGLSG